jgi:hypothetical protein
MIAVVRVQGNLPGVPLKFEPGTNCKPWVLTF